MRGISIKALKKNQEIVETLGDRILGRVSLKDVYDSSSNLIVKAGDQITDLEVLLIDKAKIDSVEVRSPLTCEARTGICAKCYGRNLATGKMVQKGEAVGVVAAQSIGEPGTQLTLRTFHVGGVAGNISEENRLTVKYNGIAEIDDLKTVKGKDSEGKDVQIVISRTAEIKVIDKKTKNIFSTNNIPYGSFIFIKNGDKVYKDDLVCSWDPFNGVIVSEFSGKVQFENIEQVITEVERFEDLKQQPKPKTSSLFDTMTLERVTFEDALQLLSLPRTVGVDPENGEEITVQNGPYGPYLKKGVETRNIATEEELLTISLEECLELLAQPKKFGRRAAKPPLKELGLDPVSEKPILLKEGQWGPYVTDGKTNASLQLGDSVEEITDERAVELLAERRAKV